MTIGPHARYGEFEMQQLLNVQGMSCGHCERAVTEAIKRVDPNATVKVDLASGRVEVQSEASRNALASAVADEGYTVT
jgi:copper chaperone